MDPNAALETLRATIADMRAAEDSGATPDYASAATVLADAADALDGWITRGGFLPDAWRNR